MELNTSVRMYMNLFLLNSSHYLSTAAKWPTIVNVSLRSQGIPQG